MLRSLTQSERNLYQKLSKKTQNTQCNTPMHRKKNLAYNKLYIVPIAYDSNTTYISTSV